VGILRRTQDELISPIRQEIQETGIGFGDLYYHFENMFQDRFEIERVADRIGNSMQDIDLARFFSQGLFELSV
jgi:hypothetical protein